MWLLFGKQDNEILYSHEEKWDVTNPDPDYHFKMIVGELNKAKAAAEAKVPGFKCATDTGHTWNDVLLSPSTHVGSKMLPRW